MGIDEHLYIKNCYARVNLSQYDGTSLAATTVCHNGCNGVHVSNCYFSGTQIPDGTHEGCQPITSTNPIPAIDSYYNKTIFGSTTGKDQAIGLEENEFSNSNNFKNWDFQNTWIIKDGYPELRIFFTH